MKHLLMISLLAGFGPAAFGQSWAPFYPGDTCIYRNDTSEFFAHTVWVDSVGLAPGKRTFFFNPSNHQCDTCILPQYYPTPPLWINRPFPFGSSLTEEDSGRYLFNQAGNESILFRGALTPGNSWLMDTVNMIVATVSTAYPDLVFGIPDSLKQISLSSGASILLSQNHGLISFPDSVSRGSQLHLAGILNRDRGEQIPDFWDIYDFQIGDILFYQYGSGDVGGSLNTEARVTIIEKTKTGNRIEFDVLMKGRSEAYAYPNTYITGFDSTYRTWTFVDSPDHVANALPNCLVTPLDLGSQAFRSPVYTFGGGTEPNLAGPVYVNPEMKQIPVFYFLDPSNYFTNLPPLDSNLLLRTYQNYFFQNRFEKGLGQTLYDFDGFESNSRLELVGYIRNGDTVGTVFTDDYLFVSTDNELPPGSIRIYPNPARDLLTISISDPKLLPVDARVLDLHGRLVRSEHLSEPESMIRMPDLPVGLYHVEVVSGRGEGVWREKVVVE